MAKKMDDGFSAPDGLKKLGESISSVILGKEEVVRKMLVSMLARGHVLIDDVPGVGKTTLARALARSIDCSFRRIQFTSDLLPSDILGVKVYEPAAGEFKFMPGPIFHCVVLADEINRTTPRTQSALLEAMSENQVTIEGETISLPHPFMVIATENPIEHHGTYPLPDSQLDRFLMSVPVGYPSLEREREMLTRPRSGPATLDIPSVMGAEEIISWQQKVDSVRMGPEVADYLLEIVGRTRNRPGLRLGASPRGSLALRQACKANALLEGRDFVLPDDVKDMAVPVLAHRVVPAGAGPSGEKRRTAREAIEEIVDSTPAPL